MQKGTAGIVILVIVGFIGFSIALATVGMALNIITIPWLKLGSQVQMTRDIVQKTYNADNALYNYHWFKERFEAIKATENKIKVAKEAATSFETSAGKRTDWTFEDKTEHARLASVTQGLKSHYEDIVAEYNARAKEADRAIFKDDLPLFFNLQPF